MIDFDNTIENFNIDDFSDTLHNFLNNDKHELYSLDRIENDIGILENRDTGNILEVPKKELPDNIKDGDIFDFFEGVFEKKDDIFDEILDNINNLKNKLTIKTTIK
ncbi:MAG: DUF3006 domain-containing protein [Clostridia bacterium]|nr:DUF3006 domain-containing protein [Clostridia bacterium]